MTTQVIRGARRKAGLLAGGGGAFCVLALGFLDRTFMFWFALIFFGGCALVGAAAVLWPARLELDDEGFTQRTFGRSHRLRWRDIEKLVLWENPDRRSGQTLVGWRLRDPAAVRGAAMSRRMTGVDGSLTGMWSVSPRALFETMQARWARAQALEPSSSSEG